MKEIELEIQCLEELTGKARQNAIETLLEKIRNANIENDWFRSQVIRGFLNKNVANSKFVPSEIKTIVEFSLAKANSLGLAAHSRQSFINSIRSDGRISELKEYRVSANDLMKSAKDEGDVLKTFAERNIHNRRYYYTKFTEWYLSQRFINDCDSAIVVDIGSAYNGFGKYAKNSTNASEINLVDLLNPKGRFEIEPRIFQVGSDAVKIDDIPDNYADIVCLHNAIEHFGCGSDDGCLSEIERMLKPGGKALITPFFFEGRYGISINPISCFFFEPSSDRFLSYLLEEHNERDANVRYSYGMVSPYAHVYDYDIIENKLGTNCPNLKPTFYQVHLEDEELQQNEVFGVEFSDDIYDKPTFFFLMLEKT